jgi:hypothetical protein
MNTSVLEMVLLNDSTEVPRIEAKKAVGGCDKCTVADHCLASACKDVRNIDFSTRHTVK